MSDEQAVTTQDQAGLMEQVVIGGDLSRLTPTQRVSYYRQVCDSLGLNWLTKPFDYLNLNGKLTLYARRDCTDQLRNLKNVSVELLPGCVIEGVYTVTAKARMPTGRTDAATGAVSIDGLKGEARANAIMKAETKAKRRVTLSIVGLGWLDETEVDSIHAAHVVPVDAQTGEILAETPNPPSPEVKATPTAPSAESKPEKPVAQQWETFYSLTGRDVDKEHKVMAQFANKHGKAATWFWKRDISRIELAQVIGVLEERAEKSKEAK